MESTLVVTPRILKDNFRSHDGNPAMLVGKVTSINNEEGFITLLVNDEKNTTVQANINADLIEIKEFECTLNEYVQVTGKVYNENGRIEVVEYCRFGKDFDLKTYNELVALSNEQFKSLFRQ